MIALRSSSELTSLHAGLHIDTQVPLPPEPTLDTLEGHDAEVVLLPYAPSHAPPLPATHTYVFSRVSIIHTHHHLNLTRIYPAPSTPYSDLPHYPQCASRGVPTRRVLTPQAYEVAGRGVRADAARCSRTNTRAQWQQGEQRYRIYAPAVWPATAQCCRYGTCR